MHKLLALLSFVLLSVPAVHAQCAGNKIPPPDPLLDSEFGRVLDVDGDVMVVGSPSWGVEATPVCGAAVVYRHDGVGWVFEQRLVSPAPAFKNRFGGAVAVSGDTIVVGEQWDENPWTDSGSAWVFRHDGAGWVLEQELVMPDPFIGFWFGAAVEVDGDLAVVAAPRRRIGDILNKGVVYVYRRTGSAWTEIQQLTQPDPDVLTLGESLDLTAGFLVAGAPATVPSDSGRAFVYEWQDPQFVQRWALGAGTTVPGDHFGAEVAGDGQRFVIAAPRHNAAPLTHVGSVSVYRRVLHDLVLEAEIPNPAPDYLSLFGFGVDVQGTVLGISSPGHDFNFQTNRSGAAYRYDLQGGAWVQQPILQDFDSHENEQLGQSVALRGDELLVGSLQDDFAGAVFSYQGLPAWEDLGQSLGGTTPITTGFGYPRLWAAGSLEPGATVTLHLFHFLAGAPTTLVVGLDEISLPFKGGVLVPSPDLLVPGLVTGADHELCLEALPGPLPPGLVLHVQAWLADPKGPEGFAASNAIRGTVP